MVKANYDRCYQNAILVVKDKLMHSSDKMPKRGDHFTNLPTLLFVFLLIFIKDIPSYIEICKNKPPLYPRLFNGSYILQLLCYYINEALIYCCSGGMFVCICFRHLFSIDARYYGSSIWPAAAWAIYITSEIAVGLQRAGREVAWSYVDSYYPMGAISKANAKPRVAARSTQEHPLRGI